MTEERSTLRALEHELWASETRFDRQKMEATLTVDFREFGRSGQRYTRSEVLPFKGQTGKLNALLHDLSVQKLSPTAALVTYISELRLNDQTEWSNRSSVWDRASGSWQLRFHQGTPTDALK